MRYIYIYNYIYEFFRLFGKECCLLMYPLYLYPWAYLDAIVYRTGCFSIINCPVIGLLEYSKMNLFLESSDPWHFIAILGGYISKHLI